MTFSQGVINGYISAMRYIRVWRLWAPVGRGPVCLAHSAHPIATPLVIYHTKSIILSLIIICMCTYNQVGLKHVIKVNVNSVFIQ